MDSTHTFRKSLLRRLLEAVSAVVVVGPAFTAGCGAKVAIDTDGGTTGLGGAGGSTTVGVGGQGGGVPMDGGCAPGSTSSGGTETAVLECVPPPAGGCPTQYDAVLHIIPSKSCVALVEVDCGPMVENGQCCYVVTEESVPCGTGRPFLVAGAPRTARAEAVDRGWGDDAVPSVAGLDAAARAALAEAWTGDALLEHASVASFARFALDLLAAGAPADLVAGAHRAALDEVRHARLCFALAGGYRGAPISPSPLPIGGDLGLSADLPALAAAAAREGCIGETIAAIVAAEQLAHAVDPAVRRALSTVADDEARHAELAWRTLAWALDRGGAPVRAAIEDVFANAARRIPFGGRASGGLAPEVAAAHGRLDADASCKAVVRALAEVVLPCANALLGRGASRIEQEPGPATQRSPA